MREPLDPGISGLCLSLIFTGLLSGATRVASGAGPSENIRVSMVQLALLAAGSDETRASLDLRAPVTL